MTLYNDSIQQLERIRTKRNPKNFRIVYMGDSWVGSGQVSDDIFEQAIKTAVSTKPLLMVHGGDIIFSGKVREFKYFISELNKWNKDEDGNRIPMFITPGNHEMDLNQEGSARIQNFKDYIGPLHFNLDLPEYHLTMIGLNTLYNYPAFRRKYIPFHMIKPSSLTVQQYKLKSEFWTAQNRQV